MLLVRSIGYCERALVFYRKQFIVTPSSTENSTRPVHNATGVGAISYRDATQRQLQKEDHRFMHHRAATAALLLSDSFKKIHVSPFGVIPPDLVACTAVIFNLLYV